MKFILNYIRVIDSLSEKSGIGVSWLSLLLVLVVCYDVIIRYLFRESSAALQEFEWHLFAILFLIAAAYTLKHDEHVRVDIFYSRFSPKTKAWIDLAGTIIFLIPLCIIIFIASKDFVINSFIYGEGSPDSGGLPARYILKAFIPASFFLLLLQGIGEGMKSFITLYNNQDKTKVN